MARYMTDSMAFHECGGAIMTAELDGKEYHYCDRCAAYTFDLNRKFPSGMGEAAIREAWDGGDIHSPDPEDVV